MRFTANGLGWVVSVRLRAEGAARQSHAAARHAVGAPWAGRPLAEKTQCERPSRPLQGTAARVFSNFGGRTFGMGLGRGFLRDKTPPRILMLAAVALLGGSQFFAYFEAPGSGLSGFEREAGVAPGIWDGMPLTGWELHPQALPILVLLSLAYLVGDVAEHPLFRRFGYWLSLFLVLSAISPGAPTRAAGAAMGGIAFLAVLIATVWQQLLPRMIVPPAVGQAPPES